MLKSSEIWSRRPRFNPVAAFAALALLVAVLSAGTVTLAKYIAESNQKTLAEAGGFRFTSDYLTNPEESYDLYDWTGGFAVTLSNTEKGVRSQVDIGYTGTVTGGKIGGSTSFSGTILASATSPVALNIVPDGGAGSTVTVNVTSTTPYNKPLSASFTLKEAGASSFYSFDGAASHYRTLTIKTGSAPAPSITVNYGDNLAPDNTNPHMAGWAESSRTGTLQNLAPNSTYILVFFVRAGTPATVSGQIFTDSITLSSP